MLNKLFPDGIPDVFKGEDDENYDDSILVFKNKKNNKKKPTHIIKFQLENKKHKYSSDDDEESEEENEIVEQKKEEVRITDEVKPQKSKLCTIPEYDNIGKGYHSDRTIYYDNNERDIFGRIVRRR